MHARRTSAERLRRSSISSQLPVRRSLSPAFTDLTQRIGVT